MRELVKQYLSRSLSRRYFVKRLASIGVPLAAAKSIVQSLTPFVHAQDGQAINPERVKVFQGTGAAAFAEQLIASGVQYVFGNSSSGDAPFYEALVDRPQLKYILTPHEGPGAAMAAGYVKASGEPAMAMEAGAVSLFNALGQMYNAFKEKTPLIFHTTSSGTRGMGRDGFEQVADPRQMVTSVSKGFWAARRADLIPETVRRAIKLAWTPPYGSTYVTWQSDFNRETVRTQVILQEKLDPRMRIRPAPTEVERAAKLLVEAKMPLMIVGDELYKARAVDKAVRLAELLGMPVTQARQVFANFPQTHPLWVSSPRFRLGSLPFAKNPDVVINVGNNLRRSGSGSRFPSQVKFIDMRIESWSMGNVITTEVPLVADVAYGLEDLIAAVQDIMTPTLKNRVAERSEQVRTFTERAKKLRSLVTKNPEWDQAPLLAERLTYEIAQFADKDAIVVHEAGSIGLEGFDFDPLGGRELFFYYGGIHLGSGVGTAAGVKLARPNQQVICLVGDGSFLFGPTALWNMARLELPVIVVVYNNHAYAGPHNRAISTIPGGRMVQTGRFVHDYLGNPDMNMAYIARGFGVEAEVVESPAQLKEALARARQSTREGKPYLIDAQVARRGVAWAEKPWTPAI